MNQQVKTQWLKALRSGEYQQARGRLWGYKGFCCLGVLCDIYVKESNHQWEEDDFGGHKIFDESAMLPIEVMTWAGLSEANPSISDRANNSLASINDRGSSFEEIADLIEKNL